MLKESLRIFLRKTLGNHKHSLRILQRILTDSLRKSLERFLKESLTVSLRMTLRNSLRISLGSFQGFKLFGSQKFLWGSLNSFFDKSTIFGQRVFLCRGTTRVEKQPWFFIRAGVRRKPSIFHCKKHSKIGSMELWIKKTCPFLAQKYPGLLDPTLLSFFRPAKQHTFGVFWPQHKINQLGKNK